MPTDATTFIVHGVGIPKSNASEVDGATLEFASAWAGASQSSYTREQFVAQPSKGPVFSYSVLSASLGDGSKHHVVEMQWADLSRIASGPLSPFIAFFKVLFGVRRVVVAGGKAFEGGHRLIAKGLGSCLYLVEGPVLALNFILFAGLGLVAFFPVAISANHAIWAMGLVPAVLSLAPPLRKWPAAQWTIAFGVIVPFIPQWPRDSTEGMFASYVGLIGLAVQLIWVLSLLAYTVSVVMWIVQRLRGSVEMRRALDVQVGVCGLALRIWLLALPLLWWYGLQLVPTDSPSQLASGDDLLDFTRTMVPVLGLNWLVVIAIALSAMASWWRFSRAESEDRSKRLILAMPIVWTVTLSTLLYLAFAIVVSQQQSTAIGAIELRLFDLSPVPGWMVETLEIVNNVGWVLLTISAVLVFVYRERVLMALDFALDVTSYFNKRGDPGRPDITARFKSIVSRWSDKDESRMTFITHSQGTVLCGDYLLKHAHPRASWVTMGSPISHLYEYYFEGLFWEKGRPKIGVDIRRWINLYRGDDFIGRQVHETVPDQETPEEIQADIFVGRGGHSGYFGDPDVMVELENLNLIPHRPAS